MALHRLINCFIAVIRAEFISVYSEAPFIEIELTPFST